MQNSFEKQVQQKMDELEFVPTAPVWQNIEKQIRAKKERRRLAFWLPLFLLLLSGGSWWFINGIQESGSTAGSKQQNAVNETYRYEVTKVRPQKVDKEEKEAGQNKASTGLLMHKPAQDGEPLLTLNSSPLSSKDKRSASSISARPDVFVEKEMVAVDASSDDLSNQKTGNPVDKDRVTALPQRENEIAGKRVETVNRAGLFKVVGTKQDSTDPAVSKQQSKQKASHSKWELGIAANVGISGVSTGLNVFSNDKAMFDSYSSAFSPSPSAFNSTPSAIKKNIAFAVGVMAKRKLSKRLALTGGLQYDYYSNHIAVGQLRRQDTVISTNRLIGRFYLNSGTGFKDHLNQFHFVSLPLSLEWQLLKKTPLHLQAGFSLQQLISTNALLFDQGSRVYYSDKDAFKKTQVFSTFGLSYTLLNKKNASLLLGPQLRYGLTKTEKDNSNHHLFSLGLSAQFLFRKQ